MSWNDIIGHDEWKQGFQRVVERGRLGHAYLFTGPAGVGKRLFAQELSKALLCENQSETLTACDQCPACIQVKAGTHPDYHFVNLPEGANEIPIETMRELCRMFTLKPSRGYGKAAVLDDADLLNPESANCFLKTLEEPPPRSVFTLIGTDAERQMATIVSRCQVIRFAPLSPEKVAEVLRRQGLDDGEHVERLVELSDGSPGKAMSLADPNLWEFRRRLLGKLAVDRPDTIGLAADWIGFVEEAGKDTASHRKRARLVLQMLIQFLQSAVAVGQGKAPSSSDREENAVLQRMASVADADALMAMIERCMEAEVQLSFYVQAALVLEGLLDSLGQIIGGNRSMVWK